MSKYETNKQWTTYRILDTTIDNPDLADPLNIGATGAAEGKGFILWGDTSAAKIEWDEVYDRLLTTTATIRMGTTDKLEFRDATHYIHSDAAEDLMINAETNLMLGISGTDVVTVAAATVTFAQKIVQDDATDATGTTDGSIQTDGGVGIAMKLFVGTNLDVAGTSALDGNVTLSANLYMPSAGVIDFNAGDVTITHAANVLTLAGGSFRIDSTNPIEFNGAGKFIKQLSVNCLQIASDGSGDTTILLSGNTRIAGFFLLYQTDTEGTSGGQMWFDTSEQKIKHQMFPAKVITLADVTRAQTFMDNITLTSDKKIQFADAGMYIHQLSADCLRIYSDGSGNTAILLSGNTRIAGYFNLYVTDTDGDSEGQIWYDTSEDKLKYRKHPNQTITVADVTRAQTFMDNIEMNDDKRISFGGAGKHIYELSANCLRIVSDGVGDSAILVSSNTRFAGFLLLFDTVTEGTTNGQIWYDSADNKFHGRAAGATVTFDVS